MISFKFWTTKAVIEVTLFKNISPHDVCVRRQKVHFVMPVFRQLFSGTTPRLRQLVCD